MDPRHWVSQFISFTGLFHIRLQIHFCLHMGFWRLCKLQVELQVVHIRFKAVYARKGAFQNIIWLFSLELKSSKILFDWIVDSCPISSDLLDVKSAILPIFFISYSLVEWRGSPILMSFSLSPLQGFYRSSLLRINPPTKRDAKATIDLCRSHTVSKDGTIIF